MYLKLNTGIAGKGVELSPGEVVDWKDEGDAGRLIERGFASKATKEEVQAAGRVRSYEPPKQRPEDRWPPGQLKNLKTGESDAA